jgi:multiple sugar transport system permease protein
MRDASAGRGAQRVLLWVGVTLIAVWTVFPFFWTLWASLMTEKELIEGLTHWIKAPTLDHYRKIFGLAESDSIFGGQTKAVARGFLNSTLVGLPTAIISVAVAALAGYALGRFRFRGKDASLMGLLTTRTLPPIAILIPYFALFSAVGLVGTYYGLILTYLTSTIPLLSWILMGYFATLPIEVERAARMDGCSRLQVLRRVIMPMAAPGIAAAFIIAFLFCWNELLFGIILTGGTPAQTLSPALLALSPLMPGFRTEFVLFAAASVLSTVPPLLLALFFQRYITGLNIVDPVTVATD